MLDKLLGFNDIRICFQLIYILVILLLIFFIKSGDILVVNRAIEPAHNKIVIAYLNGELTVKRLKIENTKIYLVAENPSKERIMLQNVDLPIYHS